MTYTLGFYLDPRSVDGKFHKLRVEVKRPGLNVTYPKGYFAFKDEPATQDESRNSFLAAIRSPLNSSAIPLEVKVDSDGQPATRSLQIVCTVGLKDALLLKDGEMRRGKLDIYTAVSYTHLYSPPTETIAASSRRRPSPAFIFCQRRRTRLVKKDQISGNGAYAVFGFQYKARAIITDMRMPSYNSFMQIAVSYCALATTRSLSARAARAAAAGAA